ncbi:hypothetical protein M3P05_20145, partial [Sansalvadorimonas sp. 2012CJ34-2]
AKSSIESMESKKIKWLIYTVVVGLIPILSRLLVWGVTKGNVVEIFVPSDFISFGLVLHISNINEIEHFDNIDRNWKTVQNGTSICFIAFYSILYSLTLFGDKFIDQSAIKFCTIGLAIISFSLSYSVYDRVSNHRTETQGVSA